MNLQFIKFLLTQAQVANTIWNMRCARKWAVKQKLSKTSSEKIKKTNVSPASYVHDVICQYFSVLLMFYSECLNFKGNLLKFTLMALLQKERFTVV